MLAAINHRSVLGHRPCPITRLALFVLTVGLWLPASLRAANIIWDGGGGTGAWGTKFNWSGNKVPASTDSVTFNAASAGSQYNISLGTNRTTQGVTFSSAAGTNYFTIGGFTLSINSGGITNNDAQTQVFNSGIYVNSAQTWNASAGGLTFAGAVGLQTNLTITGAATTTVSGVIANGATAAGTLTKAGAGTLVLSGANTYSGATNVSAGTLQLGANDALSSSSAVTIASGATVDLGGYNATLGAISGAGALQMSGGALTLGSGMNFASGSMVMNGGTLNLAGFTSSLGSLSITADSILDFGSVGSSVLTLGSLSISSGVTLTIQNWTDAVDYFYSLANPGSTNLGRIVFSNYPGSTVTWQSWDNQITPVPEPGAYGALLIAASMAFAGLFRRRRRIS